MAYKGMVDGNENRKAAEMVNSIPGIFQQDWMEGLTLDAGEQRFVNAPFGTLQPDQRAEASWLIEGMAMLAWAVDVTKLPPFYRMINGAEVSKALGIFQTDARERIEQATLRNPDEIIIGAHTYAALMWRLNEYQKERKPVAFSKKLSDADGHPIVDGLEFMDGDLAIDGLSLDKIPDEKLGMVGAIAYQRNRQFRWLLGFERGESTVTTVN
jgi:Domain of unknown function (DUF4272)